MTHRHRFLWRLRNLAIAFGVSVSTFVAIPAVASAAIPKPTTVPERTVQTTLPDRPCVVAGKAATCRAVVTYRETAHLVFPSSSALLSSAAGVAGACGNYNVNQYVSWNDYAVLPSPPYLILGLVTGLSAGGGYNGCGGSWTNWKTISCSIKLPGFDCVNYTGTCGPCGGNWKDPSHSYWNTEWYNQYERLYATSIAFESWTVYERLWNDGYGHTDKYAGES